MLVEIRCVSLVAVSFVLEVGLLVIFHEVVDDRLHCCGSLLRSLTGNHASVARDHWLSDLSEVFGIAALDTLESLELRSGDVGRGVRADGRYEVSLMPATETLHHSIILLISCGESSGWPTGRILYRVELVCFLRLGYLGLRGHGALCLQTLEALLLHLVVLHELVCSDVVRAFLLLYVLADLFEGL